jgi:hypothetical protein
MRLHTALSLLATLAAPGCGSTPGAAPFEELGDRRLTEVVEPGSYLLLELGYRLGGSTREILVSEPLAGAPPTVQADVAIVLVDVEKAAGASAGEGKGSPPAAGEPPVWTYRLGVRERWIADLDLSSGSAIGPLMVVARLNGRETRTEADAPALARWLRMRSLQSLRAVMARPRSVKAWHLAALVAFLGAVPPEALAPGGAAGLRREILDGLRASSDPRPIAEALIEKAPFLPEEELRSLGHGEDVSVRLLVLTRAAWGGRPDALKEILTLALEYHDEVLLFQESLRTLFPAARSPQLHAKHPPSDDKARAAAFIREVHEGLSRAQPLEGGGWRLEGA